MGETFIRLPFSIQGRTSVRVNFTQLTVNGQNSLGTPFPVRCGQRPTRGEEQCFAPYTITACATFDENVLFINPEDVGTYCGQQSGSIQLYKTANGGNLWEGYSLFRVVLDGQKQ